MRIAIFGAGAIGSLIGATLQKAGADVSLVARGSHLDSLRRHGLTIRSNGSEYHQEMAASDDPEVIGPQDLVVVTVKSPALPSLARQIGPLLQEHTPVCFMMNGIPWWYWHGHNGEIDRRTISLLDPDGSVSEAVGLDRVIGGVVRCSARIAAPGVLEVTSPFRHIQIGEPRGHLSKRARTLCELLCAGGIETVTVPNIHDAIWEKLISNLMDGPLAVLTMTRSDRLFQNSTCRDISFRIGKEAREIAKALGRNVQIDLSEVIENGKQRPHLPSIAEDLQLGRPMEIDSYLTVPIDWATELGIEIPTLSMVAELVRVRAAAL